MRKSGVGNFRYKMRNGKRENFLYIATSGVLKIMNTFKQKITRK